AVVAVVEGGAAGQQGHGFCRAAVVLERAEQRIDRAAAAADLVAVAAVDQTAAGAVADQVVALGDDGTRGTNIGVEACRVAGHDGVFQVDRAALGIDPTAFPPAGITGNGAAGDR